MNEISKFTCQSRKTYEKIMQKQICIGINVLALFQCQAETKQTKDQ